MKRILGRPMGRGEPYINSSQHIRAAAEARIVEQGLDPTVLDPGLVVLATNSPKESEVEAAAGETHKRLFDKMFIRGILRAPVVGALAGAAILAACGSQDYDMEKFYTGKQPERIGKPILPKNTLVFDPSILSGNDRGSNVPVIGGILRHIPGVPDMAPHKGYETKTVDRVILGHKVVLKANSSNKRTENPVAPNLTLTGIEYAQDRKSAAKLLAQARKRHISITKVSIEGLASDEFGGKFGVHDPEQQKLADDRAEIGEKAFVDEARHQHIKLPENISVDGREVVLTPAQIKKLDSAASELHTSKQELQSGSRKKLPKHIKKTLYRLIDKQRGNITRITGRERIHKKVAVHRKFVEPGGLKALNNVPGELIFGVGTLVPTIVAGGLLNFLTLNRRIRRRARREAKKAGFKF